MARLTTKQRQTVAWFCQNHIDERADRIIDRLEPFKIAPTKKYINQMKWFLRSGRVEAPAECPNSKPKPPPKISDNVPYVGEPLPEVNLFGPAPFTSEELRAVKQFADQFGGIQKLRAAVDEFVDLTA